MALGAAPTRSIKGMPAVTKAANRMTSAATPRYGAMTRATGSEMAMAATFMMKLVMIRTKKAMLMDENEPVGFFEHDQPVHRQPFGRPGFP